MLAVSVIVWVPAVVIWGCYGMGFHFHLVAVHLFDLPLTHPLYDCIYYIDIVCLLLCSTGGVLAATEHG